MNNPTKKEQLQLAISENGITPQHIAAVLLILQYAIAEDEALYKKSNYFMKWLGTDIAVSCLSGNFSVTFFKSSFGHFDISYSSIDEFYNDLALPANAIEQQRLAALSAAVYKMRIAQKNYFQKRTKNALADSKRLEMIVDNLIGNNTLPPNSQQAPLF